jgi:hypothetical protein
LTFSLLLLHVGSDYHDINVLVLLQVVEQAEKPKLGGL